MRSIIPSDFSLSMWNCTLEDEIPSFLDKEALVILGFSLIKSINFSLVDFGPFSPLFSPRWRESLVDANG